MMIKVHVNTSLNTSQLPSIVSIKLTHSLSLSLARSVTLKLCAANSLNNKDMRLSCHVEPEACHLRVVLPFLIIRILPPAASLKPLDYLHQSAAPNLPSKFMRNQSSNRHPIERAVRRSKGKSMRPLSLID
jgi:hypothetical protein